MNLNKTLVRSEIERAAMTTGVFPEESRLEATVKRRVAQVLARAATALDPDAVLLLQRGFGRTSA